VRERFAREARLTARVQHPGVVRVLDADVAGDRPYLVLEFVDGETLRHRLAHGLLPVVDAARIAAATATSSLPHTKRACCTATSSPTT
jgi:serine/threonine protein kinase